jgi:hypothetical protein
MNEINFRNYIVTCKTENCGNGGISITVAAPAENPNFICGVCSVSITNIVEVNE